MSPVLPRLRALTHGGSCCIFDSRTSQAMDLILQPLPCYAWPCLGFHRFPGQWEDCGSSGGPRQDCKYFCAKSSSLRRTSPVRPLPRPRVPSCGPLRLRRRKPVPVAGSLLLCLDLGGLWLCAPVLAKRSGLLVSCVGGQPGTCVWHLKMGPAASSPFPSPSLTRVS